MKRIALGIEYDGAGFQGWQTQPHGGTVQDALERALCRFGSEPIHTMCAGRTDAGVHALEQVVHFDTELNREMYSWVSGVNSFLSKSVAVKWAVEVGSAETFDNHGFHARFSAYSRTYHYVLLNSVVRSPTLSGRAGWFFRPLDLERMQDGAAYLLGEHDFSSFRATGCQAKSPIKTMYQVDIRRSGELIIFTLRASAFLHHMVRNIVGSLLFVGAGRRSPEWMAELLLAKNRSLAAPTFMPDGLYLAKIEYDPKWGIPNDGQIALPMGMQFAK